jgi:hypothetical protein
MCKKSHTVYGNWAIGPLQAMLSLFLVAEVADMSLASMRGASFENPDPDQWKAVAVFKHRKIDGPCAFNNKKSEGINAGVRVQT